MNKRLLLVILTSTLSFLSYAGTYKLVHVETPGTFSSSHGLVYEAFPMITSLKITGHLDANDFIHLRDYFTKLEMLDLSEVDILANTLPEYALSNMTMDSLLLPNSIRTLGRNSVYNCAQLKHVTMPLFLDSIGPSAFLKCVSLRQIDLNHFIQHIEEGAFSGCWALDSVKFEASISKLANNLFNACSSLTSINLPLGIEHIGEAAFIGNSSLVHIGLPNSLKSIGFAAFEGCTKLEELRLPGSIDSIAYSFMDNCQGLKSLHVYNSTPVRMNFRVTYFNYVPKTAILYVPAGTRETYHYASGWEYFWPNIVERTSTTVETTTKSVSACRYDASTGCIDFQGIEKNSTFSLYDLKGKIMQHSIVSESNSMYVGRLNAGLYFARWSSANGMRNQKILVE